ncbi:universal stress protein [Ornithinimicrobium tianjinense]|uniref:Universal stress protein UspA n=1 Tax=Ornithinimicrobium tianjinense TaxID=1195761 RepID=A0A917BEG6_9MICO|nr:universal stress protein [Ornithinimicrobium tianjinense]GGF40266.1 universal stress protein UspA [Ornithinimicrobium tianjinense]
MAVVVGFIPTPEGTAALAEATREARRRGAKVVLVASYDPAQAKEAGARKRFRDALDRAAEQLAAEGLEHEVRTMERGRLPSEDVLEVAEEIGAEVIVIGLRRRSAVGKFLLGSHAQQILMDAPCPVLSVKAG